MKIFSDFKFKDFEYVNRLARPGDVVVIGCLKYIRTEIGYISELGFVFCLPEGWDKNVILIKKEYGEYLEDLLIEGEKRACYT